MFVTNAFGTPKNTELNQMVPYGAQENLMSKQSISSKMATILSDAGQHFSRQNKTPQVRLDIVV